MLKTKEEIKAWLDRYKIKGYTINDNLVVDVEGGVNLSGFKLKEIPIQFGIVNVFFDCSKNELVSCAGFPMELNGNLNLTYNNITSLVGCPKEVESFYCYNNKLTSLVGGPEKVTGWYDCSKNELTSLIGSPSEVGYTFNCRFNKLENLDNSPISVGHNFMAYNNPIKSLEGFYCNFGEMFQHSGEFIPNFENFYQNTIDSRLLLHITHKDLMSVINKLELMKELSELKVSETTTKKPKI